MPMLSLMSGGPWEMVETQFQKEMLKNLAAHKRDEPPIKDIYLPSRKPF